MKFGSGQVKFAPKAIIKSYGIVGLETIIGIRGLRYGEDNSKGNFSELRMQVTLRTLIIVPEHLGQNYTE